MNNKGFTIVELLASFVLSSVIIIIMFQLIINLKELYQTSGLKTELINKQNIMTNKIYTDLIEKELIQFSSCGSGCIDFTFNDNTNKTLYVDTNNGTLSYDNYAIKLNNKSYFSTVEITVTEAQSKENNMILNINVPIYNENFKNDNFGINIVYTYNSNKVASNY